jgi:hypothetical protein
MSAHATEPYLWGLILFGGSLVFLGGLWFADIYQGWLCASPRKMCEASYLAVSFFFLGFGIIALAVTSFP